MLELVAGAIVAGLIEVFRRRVINAAAGDAVEQARKRHPEKPIRSSRLVATAHDRMADKPFFRKPLTRKGKLRAVVRALDAREAAEAKRGKR